MRVGAGMEGCRLFATGPGFHLGLDALVLPRVDELLGRGPQRGSDVLPPRVEGEGEGEGAGLSWGRWALAGSSVLKKTRIGFSNSTEWYSARFPDFNS